MGRQGSTSAQSNRGRNEYTMTAKVKRQTHVPNKGANTQARNDSVSKEWESKCNIFKWGKRERGAGENGGAVISAMPEKQNKMR